MGWRRMRQRWMMDIVAAEDCSISVISAPMTIKSRMEP